MIRGIEALTLAIDIGSSSVRAMIFDDAGRRLGGVYVQQRYDAETTPDGGVMIDPAHLCEMFDSSIDAALHQSATQVGNIKRVAFDSLVGNVLGLDASGTPVTPIYTWADTRGNNLGETLRGRLDAAAYRGRTGCRIHTSYWPVRLLWLSRNEAAMFRRVSYWVTLGDYLLYRMFGTRRISLSAASWTGLLDRHNLAWDAEMIDNIPIQMDQLSELSDAPFRGLTGRWAQRWPALKNVAWFPAVGDGVASNIGAGCAGPDRVAISIGTSGAMRVVVPGTPEATPEGLFVYRVDSGRSLVGGALSNAGNLYGWLRKLTRGDEDKVNAAAAALEPDSHGLTVLPFLAGERAPGWNDAAQAVFMGMTFDTGPEHLMRAALEAVSYRFYQVAERMGPLLPANKVYIASGAPVLNSPMWMQILADVLDAPVFANAESEATIRGTAFLATGVDPEPQLSTGYRPDPERHAIYQAAIARQVDLYRRLFAPRT